jgi:hypothetical protein
MTTAKNTLIKARALIADPARWTQNALARDAHGDSHPQAHPQSNNISWDGLRGDDPQACSWCAIGAVQHVEPSSLKALKLLDEAAETRYGLSTANVNDVLGHEAVLEIYDHAIEEAQ